MLRLINLAALGLPFLEVEKSDRLGPTPADADGNQSLTCYDGDGNVTQTVPPIGVAGLNLSPSSCPTSYPADYAAWARLAADATTWAYNAAGGKTVMTTPDPAGQSHPRTRPPPRPTMAPEPHPGQRPARLDRRARSGHHRTYNAAGRMASQTAGYGTPAVSTTTWCYDPNGDRPRW